MSLWYKKHELARRYAIFYSASQLAGAFGGLLGRSLPYLYMCNHLLPLYCLQLARVAPANMTAGAILEGLGGRSGLPAVSLSCSLLCIIQ